MLRLEAATGYKIPKEAEAGMLRNFWRYTDNPWGILLDVDDNPDDAAKWYIHSFRETMLTYAALVRYRKSNRAAEAGSRAVRHVPRMRRSPPGRFHFHQTTDQQEPSRLFPRSGNRRTGAIP